MTSAFTFARKSSRTEVRWSMPSLGLRDKELDEGHDGDMLDCFKRIDIGEPKVGGRHDDIYLDATAVSMESREAAVEVLVRRPAETWSPQDSSGRRR